MTPPPVPLARVIRVLRDHDLLQAVLGPEDVVVSGASQDSRDVAVGDLFLAWKGVERDAHDYVPAAVQAGAAAVVVERPVDRVDVTQLVVSDGRLAGAFAADLLYGSPWREQVLVAITGTNGKTTTALLVRHILARGGPAAALGTLGLVGPEGKVRPGTEGLTTPGPVQLSGWLRVLLDEGVRQVALEASSHALAQHRLDAIRIGVAVFTNLTREHLDYHADLEDYFQAKARLLELLRDGGVAVVNRDQEAWRRLPDGVRRLTFSMEADDADLRAESLELGPAGSRFVLSHLGERHTVEFPLVGGFNVENALAAAGAALACGMDLETVAGALSTAPQVPGRLERISDRPCPVVVDFAHTPDALDAVLGAVEPLVRGRLIVLFGAGGDRDRTKRRPMAEAVARHADLIVLTSDNPRTEDAEAILDQLAEGLAGREYERITDRRSAIGRALELARADDLVVLAGKGHERYQVVGTEKRPFDERQVVREHLGSTEAA